MNIASRLKGRVERAAFDFRAGVYTGGLQPTRYADQGACDTVSTDLRILPFLLNPVLRKGDVFVDIGCGRGRVLHWVLARGLASEVVGIELDKRVAAAAAKSLDGRMDATVIAGNALNSLPDAATLLYLWNPFNADVMAKFRDVVVQKYTRLGTLKSLRIVYHNAMHAEIWGRVEDLALPEWVSKRAVLVTF